MMIRALLFLLCACIAFAQRCDQNQDGDVTAHDGLLVYQNSVDVDYSGSFTAADLYTIFLVMLDMQTCPQPLPPPPPPPASYSVTFSTLFGGNGADWWRDAATDAVGNIYVAGGSASSNFPTAAGAYDTTYNGVHDVVVAKFSPTGQLLWSTFLGGPNYDRAYAIEIDNTGVYVAGRAGSGFPITPGAPQPNFAGDNNQNAVYGPQDGFISKLSLDGGTLLWSTYIGDTGRGFFRDIALDGQGNVYGALCDVGGAVALVPTSGVYDSTHNGGYDGVIVKLGTDGTFKWATYFGGSGNDVNTPSIRADASGVYVLGNTNSSNIPTTAGLDQTFGGNGVGDMHLAKFSPDGTQLLFGTYVGGSAVEFSETHALALATNGDIYGAFTTASSGLATTGAYDTTFNGSGTSGCGNYCHDGIIVRWNSSGQVVAATYFGGTNGEGIEGVAVNPATGAVTIGGASYSNTLPMTPNAWKATYSGNGDAFVAEFSADLSTLIYSTYIGAGGNDFGRTVWADAQGIYSAGHSTSSGFPLVNAVSGPQGGTDAFLVKIAR